MRLFSLFLLPLVLLASPAQAREVLTEARAYYVRMDGSDANDGLAPTAAFRTIQVALAAIDKLDANNKDVTLNIGPGTWVAPKIPGSGSFYILQQPLGTRMTDFSGATSAFKVVGAGAGKTIISLWARGYTQVSLHSMTIKPMNWAGLMAGEHAEVIIGTDVEFIGGGSGTTDIFAYDHGAVTISDNVKIGPGTRASHFSGDFYGRYHFLDETKVMNVVGTPTFSAAFFDLRDQQAVRLRPLFNSNGSAIGRRFRLNGSNCTITVGNVNEIPGNQSGVTVPASG